MKQYISFGPSAGICNRIKRLFSALRLNVNLDEPLDFYWSQGELTNHAFYELFTFDMFDFNEISCQLKVNKKDEYDVAANIVWRLELKDGEVPAGFTKSFKKDDESKEYIDFEYNRIPRNAIEIYRPYFEALKPSEVVKKRISEVELPADCVSVHVRQGRYWNEYSRGNRDSVDAFIEAMRNYSEDTCFFLAAANDEVAIKIKEAFPNRIVELPNKNFTDAIDAVAELYLLGQTDELLATYGSTFSEVAWWLGGCKQRVTVIGNEADWAIKCPICGAEAKGFKTYTRKELLELYQHSYKEIPEDMEIVDYNIMGCKECALVFANPMKSASQRFRVWMNKQDRNDLKWEWDEIDKYVKENEVNSLLEIGCGTGEFLKYLRKGNAITLVGMDMAFTRSNPCENEEITFYNFDGKNGYKTYNEALEIFVANSKESYDVVVALQLIEQLENPVDFVVDMMKLLNSGGKCIVGISYNDSRFSQCDITANNMPPYHLTRWDLSAIKALAKKVEAKIEIVGPNAENMSKDIWDDLRNKFFPMFSNSKISKRRIMWELIKHPRCSFGIINSQIAKRKIELKYNIGGSKIHRRPPRRVLVVFEKI